MYATDIQDAIRDLNSWSCHSVKPAAYGVILALGLVIVTLIAATPTFINIATGLCFILLALNLYITAKQTAKNMMAAYTGRLASINREGIHRTLSGPFDGIGWVEYFSNITTGIAVVLITGALGPVPTILTIVMGCWYVTFWWKYRRLRAKVKRLQSVVCNARPEGLDNYQWDIVYRAKHGDCVTMIDSKEFLQNL